VVLFVLTENAFETIDHEQFLKAKQAWETNHLDESILSFKSVDRLPTHTAQVNSKEIQ
jgi:hypothetical protein